jgi:hypothetical protein
MKKRKPKIIEDKKQRGEWAEMKFMARAAEHGLPGSKPWGDSNSRCPILRVFCEGWDSGNLLLREFFIRTVPQRLKPVLFFDRLLARLEVVPFPVP